MSLKMTAQTVLLVLASSMSLSAQDRITANIVDASGSPFSEGALQDYYVRNSFGQLVCANPFVIGQYISCSPQIEVEGVTYKANTDNQVYANTSGALFGYFVVAEDGLIVCESPTVYPEFRGPESYITCE